MTRVTLDNNELVSAFNFDGRALDLIRHAVDGDIEIAISEPILAETVRVLREKFEWQPHRLHALRERLLKTCRLVEPKNTLAVLADEPDNRILECAQEASRVKEHAGAKIVRAIEFLAQVRKP